MLLTLTLTPWECSKSAQVLYLNHDHALQGQRRQVCNVFSQSMQTYDELLFKKHWQYTEMHKQT